MVNKEEDDIMKIINNLESSKEEIIIFSKYLLNIISNIYNKGEIKWKKELAQEQ